MWIYECDLVFIISLLFFFSFFSVFLFCILFCIFIHLGSGGLFSGLGGKPSQENANKNVFGSLNFGEAKPQSGKEFPINSVLRLDFIPYFLSFFHINCLHHNHYSAGLFGGGANQQSTTFGGMAFGGAGGSGANAAFSSPVGQTAQGGFGVTTPQKSSKFFLGFHQC